MTSVAAIYDIHGNLPALEATLEDIRRCGIRRIVVGGDIVLGPMPGETLRCLQSLGESVSYIRGNCDRLVAAHDPSRLATLPASVRASVLWCAEQLDHDERRFLADLPFSATLSIHGLGDVRLVHATPRNDEEVITERTPLGRMREVFGACAERVIVCGHTHVQFDRVVDSMRIINAGSVGMPFEPPGAYWLQLGETTRLQRTDYDIADAARRIRATAYPEAASFAATIVETRPTSGQ